MAESGGRVLGWGAIVAIMLVTGVVIGALLGMIGAVVGLSPSVTTGGVGVSMGVIGAILIGRRRAALSQQPPS